MTKGIFYVATGDKFIKEACLSARSVKEYMPDVHITGYFDTPPEGAVFDDVKIIENPTHSFGDKIPPFLNPPYDHNIFIDTDVLCLENFEELFSVLDKHELGITHCVIRDCSKDLNAAPEWFPELNTGVVVFKKEGTQNLFKSWSQKHQEYREIKGKGFNDQPAFRHSIYHSDIKWTVLPREYNLRPVHGWLAAGHARVKLLHGRGYPVRKALKRVNKVSHRHRGEHLKPRVGDLNLFDRIWWKFLRLIGLDEK